QRTKGNLPDAREPSRRGLVRREPARDEAAKVVRDGGAAFDPRGTMSATRLLILGVLRLKQPVHGYDVRRELEAWRAERWANIAYGSIYFALNKMAEEGLVEAVGTDQVGRRPARTQYKIT